MQKSVTSKMVLDPPSQINLNVYSRLLKRMDIRPYRLSFVRCIIRNYLLALGWSKHTKSVMLENFLYFVMVMAACKLSIKWLTKQNQLWMKSDSLCQITAVLTEIYVKIRQHTLLHELRMFSYNLKMGLVIIAFEKRDIFFTQ